MKIILHKVSVVLLLAASTALFAALAQENRPIEEPAFENDFPGDERPNWQMPDEMIDQMLRNLKNQDPNTAERLITLRTENPEQFRTEFRKAMRDNWSKMRQKGIRSWPKSPGQEQFEGHKWPHPEVNENQCGPGGRRMAEMRQKHQEYIEWLQNNYPEDANELESIRENNPELYMRKMMQSVRKYGRIAEAEKDNPELAEVLKEDVVLKENRDAILKKMRTADDKQKEALTKELTKITSEQFDLIIKRKQIQHQQLLKKLDNLKEQIKNSEAEVDKWKALKDEKVNERVKELLSKTEKFQWD